MNNTNTTLQEITLTSHYQNDNMDEFLNNDDNHELARTTIADIQPETDQRTIQNQSSTMQSLTSCFNNPATKLAIGTAYAIYGGVSLGSCLVAGMRAVSEPERFGTNAAAAIMYGVSTIYCCGRSFDYCKQYSSAIRALQTRGYDDI